MLDGGGVRLTEGQKSHAQPRPTLLPCRIYEWDSYVLK